jgi:hypothetical protein
MTALHEEMIRRFGADHIVELPLSEDEVPLLLIDLVNKGKLQLRILLTNGLSEYKMPVPEKFKERAFNELFFCLPSYWDLNDRNNPTMNWVFVWIQKLYKHVTDKATWFGPGHTIPCGNPFKSLSETMKSNHLFLIDPMLMKEEMIPFEQDDKTTYFLAILPIFEDEMDYKRGKGTFKLLEKLANSRISEKLDDYRATCLKRRWMYVKKS